MESVKIIECPRDAWQALKHQIPTDRKVRYLRALVAAGFRHIDAVSFVSPKTVPQMADSEQVLQHLGRLPDVEIIGIVVNEQGAQRAIATGGVNTLGYPCSISETFLRRNQNQSVEENQSVLGKIKGRADDAGLAMVAYISMAFGNPYGDAWNEQRVVEAAKMVADLGVSHVSIADTIGAADPELISRVVTAVVKECPKLETGIHMHSARLEAPAKVLAAFDAGCHRFDSTLGGLGGCPFAQDELVGNIPTEEVLNALNQRGVELPIKEKLAEVADLNAAISVEFAGSG